MASKSSVKRDHKTKPTKTSKRRGTKRKKKVHLQCLEEDCDIALPTWDEVHSDDSLNDFIVDKTPTISSNTLKRRLLFDSSDDDDEEVKPLNDETLLALKLEENGKTNCLKRKKSSATTPHKISINLSHILSFDESPPAKQPSIAKKNKKGLTDITDKLRTNKESISEKEKRKRFLEHVLKRIEALDEKILKHANFELKSIHSPTPNTSNRLSVNQNVDSPEVRRSTRKRKSVVRRSSCIISHWQSRQVNTIKDEIVPLDAVDVEKIAKNLATFKMKTTTPKRQNANQTTNKRSTNSIKEQTSTKSTPKQNSKKQRRSTAAKEEAIKRAGSLKVLLRNIPSDIKTQERSNSAPVLRSPARKTDRGIKTNVLQLEKSNNSCVETEETHNNSSRAHCSSVEDEDVDIETGVVQLKPKEKKKMGTLSCRIAVYTEREGRALVVVNGTEYVVTECGEVRVEAGDQYSIKNLDNRTQLVMHFCKILA